MGTSLTRVWREKSDRPFLQFVRRGALLLLFLSRGGDPDPSKVQERAGGLLWWRRVKNCSDLLNGKLGRPRDGTGRDSGTQPRAPLWYMYAYRVRKFWRARATAGCVIIGDKLSKRAVLSAGRREKMNERIREVEPKNKNARRMYATTWTMSLPATKQEILNHIFLKMEYIFLKINL